MKLYLCIAIGLISLNIVFANSFDNAQIKSVTFIGNKNIKFGELISKAYLKRISLSSSGFFKSKAGRTCKQPTSTCPYIAYSRL